MSADRPWYETAFACEYLEVYPHRDLASARSEVAGLVESGLAGRVLDLGCGHGRHTRALRASGLVAFGLDLSAELLGHALEGEGGQALCGRLVRGDFRGLPFAAQVFDAVTMLFSSFGYFDEAGNRRVLAEIARVLVPGGTVVLDLMNAERIRRTLVPETTTERDGRVLRERRALSADGRRVRKEVVLVDPDGAERRWSEDVRLFEPAELTALLADHALTLTRHQGDFDGTPTGTDAPRHIVWARRTGP